MIPALDGCRLIVKPQSSWRSDSIVEDDIKKPMMEKPVSILKSSKHKSNVEKKPVIAQTPPVALTRKQSLFVVDCSQEQQRVRELEQRLAAIEQEKQADLEQIRKNTNDFKLEIRRLANKEEAETIKTHMKCKY